MVVSNLQVAEQLEEIARLLHERGANPFRTAAYRKAALSLRRAKQPLAEILDHDGSRGLRQLPGVGESLSKKIAEIIRDGRSKSLERLRRKRTVEDLLRTLPSVGPRLAGRIQGKLGIKSLDELLAAAHDGRLRRVAGLGRKRVEAIRESLAARLNHPDAGQLPLARGPEPAVSELLEIDRQYRVQAAQRRLLTVAPAKANPSRAAWLPILRVERGGYHYLAHYTNTEASRRYGRLYDWVAIFREDKEAFGQWTVVTARRGPLGGRRVVRGREQECREYYGQTSFVQRRLPQID